MRRKKGYNDLHTIHDLVDSLREIYRYKFTEQEGCHIIKNILRLTPSYNHCYRWYDFFRACDENNSIIKNYIEHLRWKNEPMETQRSDDEDMKSVSQELLDRDIYDFRYESVKPSIIISESQFRRLFEQ